MLYFKSFRVIPRNALNFADRHKSAFENENTQDIHTKNLDKS